MSSSDLPGENAPLVEDRPATGLSACNATDAAALLKAVGHPLRLRILALLCAREMTVSAMTGTLGVGQALVSQQLRILRMARLVDVTREGGWGRYRLIERHIRELIGCLERCCGGWRPSPADPESTG